MGTWSGTVRKLTIGFGALVLTLALASYWALAGLAAIRHSVERTKQEEEGVRVALDLASAVRDQYAHQAHTIIIGNDSHLEFYSEAEERVVSLTNALRSRARDAEESAWVADIQGASAKLDTIFRQRIVPAVLRGDREHIEEEHDRAQLVVTDIQDRTQQLVGHFDARIAAARSDAAGVERRTERWIFALLIGAPVLAAAIAAYVGRSIAKPLGKLSAGAQRLAQGDLDSRIDVTSRDEFGALARQFNAMTASLKEHQTQLVNSEKLATVGRLAAGVAHEINNPLGVILGYVRLLRKGADSKMDEDLAIVEEETLRCKEIVQDLLDLSRPVQVKKERIDLRELCDETIHRLDEAKVLDGVEVTVEGRATTEGDPSKIKQVVANLVRNAAEAAGKDGEVRVAIVEAERQVAIAIRDSGAGLGDGVRARLFEPFFTTKDRGTGLGLAVSRAIARAHGGDVDADNAPEGGALFTFRLPQGEAR